MARGRPRIQQAADDEIELRVPRLECAAAGTSRRTPAFPAAKLAANARMNHGETGVMPASRTATSSAMPNPTNPQRRECSPARIALLGDAFLQELLRERLTSEE